ncbi:MAG: DUF1569 domain-containing protein [Pirellulales bacterium]|nr:DUF1569 domain-containing protein [Pirellulales bacterium]
MASTATTTVVKKEEEVDTRRVPGRRDVHYRTMHDVLDDVERIAAGPYRTVGNWSLAQICAHLSKGLNLALDGNSIPTPWPIRIAARLFFKRRLIEGPMPAGFKLKGTAVRTLVPRDDTELATAVGALRESIARWQKGAPTHPHFMLGPMTPAQWDSLQLRHAELHMSFVQPE